MKKFINSNYGKISCTILAAGGLSLLIYVLKRWPKPKPKPETEPTLGPKSEPQSMPKLGPKSVSIFLRELHGGYRAWNRLETETYKEAQISSAPDSAGALQQELQKELPDLMILQQNVEDLENSEKEGVAENILAQALKKASDKPHEAYEIEMLLVEVLIYKGGKQDLETALKCKCLKDESLKDARRPLFKAIIYQMLGSIKEAKQHWDEFIVVRDPAFRREIDFDHFKRHVDRLLQANARQNHENS
ncbi:hypothetical protein AAZX31_15G089700 [Glycine max]|uniref:Uncharacterized protein n=2 Tax=Glycine subgen. Soja TaxID=1462606 RepID=I1MF32_SOYBN|nr:uncharacterized protein LOC100809217 [Glycine max]XP_028203472.1 uncharacterized protein LOC114387478 [Glycine soja]KAG4956116.1 hypothetical protein JHK85_042496 [Glycine max]KAG5104857.1 hypothetical protein JHK82_041827 [Glycine max]KAG5115983.1 hypothetical protein JHK84_042096 [Glycine max]KAH1146386.1 hypothetical protein GYH30_041843 [Glycine max]KAH1208433.1 hypothetical protein GmHk_15G043248 [Glycine max]|eukprot:XP_003547204.1 uncharacterized protein LOC100809217 [Glycine max]